MTRSILVLAAALTLAGAAYPAAPLPITAQVLGVAQVAKPFQVDVSKPADLIVVQAKLMPGGSFGWHMHRSAVAVAVVAGTLTLYDSSDPHCKPQHVTAGHGFFEQPNHVHLARNDGATPVRVLVTYLGVPHGKGSDVPATQPAQCASVK
jgi:quercetin dioxygenase-like cupin family protein